MVGPSTLNMVAVCHGLGSEARDEAQKLADSECAKTSRTATFDHQSTWGCTLLTPDRAFYRCVTKP